MARPEQSNTCVEYLVFLSVQLPPLYTAMALSELTNQTIAEMIILGGMTVCALSVSLSSQQGAHSGRIKSLCGVGSVSDCDVADPHLLLPDVVVPEPGPGQGQLQPRREEAEQQLPGEGPEPVNGAG